MSKHHLHGLVCSLLWRFSPDGPAASRRDRPTVCFHGTLVFFFWCVPPPQNRHLTKERFPPFLFSTGKADPDILLARVCRFDDLKIARTQFRRKFHICSNFARFCFVSMLLLVNPDVLASEVKTFSLQDLACPRQQPIHLLLSQKGRSFILQVNCWSMAPFYVLVNLWADLNSALGRKNTVAVGEGHVC